MEKVNVKDLSRDELNQFLEGIGEPRYCANQNLGLALPKICPFLCCYEQFALGAAGPVG